MKLNMKTILSTIVLGSMLIAGTANAKDKESNYDMCLDMSKASVLSFKNYETDTVVDGYTGLVMAIKETSYDSTDKSTEVKVDLLQFGSIVESGIGVTLPDKIGAFKTSVEKNGTSAISLITFNGDAFSATQQNVLSTKHATGHIPEMLTKCPL